MASGAGSSGGTALSVPVATHVVESAVLDAAADEVWALLRSLDFGAMFPKTVASCAVEDGPAQRVGSRRSVAFVDGAEWTLVVDELSDAERFVSWTILTAVPAAAWAAASHSLRVRSITTSGQALLEWSSDYSSDASVEVTQDSRHKKLEGFAELRGALAAAAVAACEASLAVSSLPDSMEHKLMGKGLELQVMIDRFLAAGGKLLQLEPGGGKLVLASDDWLYPVCSSGQNRSQVMRELLVNAARAAGSSFTGRVMRSHAALSGIDAYVDDAGSYSATTPQLDHSFPCFKDAFGHNRVPRAGEDETGCFGSFLEAGDAQLVASTKWFTEHYYARPAEMPAGARQVYISFDKPAHAVMKRLVDSLAPGKQLQNVVVAGIPMGDIIAHPDDPEATPPSSAASVMAAYATFQGMLDFSQLGISVEDTNVPAPAPVAGGAGVGAGAADVEEEEEEDGNPF